MGSQVLVADKKYEGQFVALESFSTHRVVASGDNPSTVVEEARKKGVKTPVLLFVPQKDLTHIY